VACGATGLTGDFGNGWEIVLAGLEFVVLLEVDNVGDSGLERSVEAGTRSSVTFCWAKREEIDGE
jgi:hypothetical protein